MLLLLLLRAKWKRRFPGDTPLNQVLSQSMFISKRVRFLVSLSFYTQEEENLLVESAREQPQVEDVLRKRLFPHMSTSTREGFGRERERETKSEKRE